MADMWHLCKHQNKKVFYHPFDFSSIEIIKPKNKIILCHSPYSSVKMGEKGSNKIINSFEYLKNRYGNGFMRKFNTKNKNYNLEYKILNNLSWIDCLNEKAKSHIFVDQFIKECWIKGVKCDSYVGGLAKSGIEAMLLKSLCITSGRKVVTDIPIPPVIFCNDKLNEAIEKYIIDEKLRNEVIEQQYQWAKQYTSFEFVAKRFIN
jgi:hypothetical protein